IPDYPGDYLPLWLGNKGDSQLLVRTAGAEIESNLVQIPLTGKMSSRPHSQVEPDINPWLIAIAVMSSTFMEVLDTTVVNVSLPHIAGSLSASVDEATWTLTSYLVANAIVLPLTGWLASRFGRKRLLLTAVTGFTTASFFAVWRPRSAFSSFFES